jgi:serine/threonine protein kinase/regulator of sirC expression with transglutaminase-like and TPR domain
MTGQILADRYQIIEFTASTAFGETFIASDTYRPGYPRCIVKRLHILHDSPKTPQMLRLLMQKRIEIRKQLGESEHVPKLLDFFEDGQDFYQVEELIDGHFLSQELVPGQPLTEERVIRLLQDLLEILVFIHSRDVLHQDIQPDNLIRRESDGKLLLLNFWLVREMNAPGVTRQRRSPNQSVAYALLYKPVEQLQGKPVPASDLYAVGIIAIRAITGLSGEAVYELQHGSKTGEIHWRQHPTNSKLADFVDRLVHPDHNRRYQTATEALHDLMQLWVEPVPTPPKSVTPPPEESPQPPQHSPTTTLPPFVPASSTQLVVSGQPSRLGYPFKTDSITMPTSATLEPPPKPTRRWRWIIGAVLLLLLGGLIFALYRRFPQKVLAQQSIQQGLALNEKQNYQQAIAAFNRAIAMDANNSEAFYDRALTYSRLGKDQEALADVTQAIQLDPNHARAHLLRGNLRFQLGDDRGALDDYNRAIFLDPKQATAYLNRGSAHAAMANEQAALADYNQAIAIDPKLTPAYLNRCLTRSNLNDQAGAIQDCTQAISLQPDYAYAYQNRGLAYRRIGDIQKAIADFNVAIRLSAKDADPYYNRGIARQELGDEQGAINDFSTAIQLNPKHTLVYYDRGLLRAKLGDQQGAIQDLEQAAKLCLDEGRTDCYKDTQYQLKKLRS